MEACICIHIQVKTNHDSYELFGLYRRRTNVCLLKLNPRVSLRKIFPLPQTHNINFKEVEALL